MDFYYFIFFGFLILYKKYKLSLENKIQYCYGNISFIMKQKFSRIRKQLFDHPLSFLRGQETDFNFRNLNVPYAISLILSNGILQKIDPLFFLNWLN